MPTPSVSELPTPLRPRTVRRGSVVPYDFRHPTKLSREHVRLLQMACETFARRLTTVLTSGLREVCTVTVAEITQQSYDDYIGRLATPTLMVPIDIPPLPGTGVLEFSLPVALAAVDHMLGGPGGSQLNRGLTDIESTLVGGLLDQVLGVLRYALESIIDLHPTAGAIEYNPQFLQAAAPSDAVIVVEFELAIGAERSPLTLCLPLPPLLPLLSAHRRRDATSPADDGSHVPSHRVRERLGDVFVDMDVRFRPVTLTPATILELAVGDVVTLDHRVGAPLSISVGNVHLAQAVAGRTGNRLAALIVDTPVDIPKEHA